jgi:hypothetical protein
MIIWSTRPGSLAGFARSALAEQSSAANRRPPRWQRGGGVRNNAYLQLLLCEERQAAAQSGIGDGSRLYPAPVLGPPLPPKKPILFPSLAPAHAFFSCRVGLSTFMCFFENIGSGPPPTPDGGGTPLPGSVEKQNGTIVSKSAEEALGGPDEWGRVRMRNCCLHLDFPRNRGHLGG